MPGFHFCFMEDICDECLHSRWINVDTIFRDDMPQQLAFIHGKEALLWIEINPKLSASLKHNPQMVQMLIIMLEMLSLMVKEMAKVN